MYVVVFVFELGVVFFFFKQETAYEMRISDWSSDVCSSDLSGNCGGHDRAQRGRTGKRLAIGGVGATFGTGDEGGAQLGSDGAEIKRGADAPAIHDSPSRDDRRATSLHQQAGQRHCAKATVRRVWIEDAAMAARFPSLSHNRADPCFRRGNRSTRLNS